MPVLLALLPGLVPLAILVVVFLVLNPILRRTGGHAPSWRLRCPCCATTRDAGAADVVRVGAASVGKRVLGYCSRCHQFRMLALEATPAE